MTTATASGHRSAWAATRGCSKVLIGPPGASGLKRDLEVFRLNSHAKQKFAAVALPRGQVLEPVAVDEDGCAAPGVVDPDAVEHGKDLAQELLLARRPCLGFN